MHTGRTLVVGGVRLTVAPGDDGRMAISVGDKTAHLREAEAMEFLALLDAVGSELFSESARETDPPGHDEAAKDEPLESAALASPDQA